MRAKLYVVRRSYVNFKDVYSAEELSTENFFTMKIDYGISTVLAIAYNPEDAIEKVSSESVVAISNMKFPEVLF